MLPQMRDRQLGTPPWRASGVHNRLQQLRMRENHQQRKYRRATRTLRMRDLRRTIETLQKQTDARVPIVREQRPLVAAVNYYCIGSGGET
jgi:hypothetical protein